MGERKGTNKYYPPDYDPKKGGLNKFMGTHALRERARKLHLGIIIIRFEMPYNIWCEGCNNHIGMGVRYNAEKTKVGMYYSTPVYQFRMKCHLCDNHFEIKTDPANLDYEIISGARRQERRWDPTENGQVVPDDKQVIHKLADDAMFKLQHGVEDQRKLRDVKPTLAKLEGLQERWKDDYMANRALRDQFRARKRELQDQQNKDNDFLKKRSLEIKLLPEIEDDAKVASLIRLQPAKSSEERQREKRAAIDKKSKFPFSATATSTSSSSVTENNKMEIIEKDSLSTGAVPLKSKSLTLEIRRKSLGIKLKTDKTLVPSTVKTSPIGSFITSLVRIPTAVANVLEDDKNSSIVNEEKLDKQELLSTVSQPNQSNCSDNSVSKSSDDSVFDDKTVDKIPTQSSLGNITSVESSSSVSGLRTDVGRLSSLVSYSDDSNNSSTGSQLD